MERLRVGSPVYSRQKSISNNSSGPQSPTAVSPVYSQLQTNRHHFRTGSAGVVSARRGQNNAARAAAQRLARVMANQYDDEDEEEEDDDDFSGPPLELLTTPRRGGGPRAVSPAINRYLAEQTPFRQTPMGKHNAVTKATTLIPPIRSAHRLLGTDPPSGSTSEASTPVSVRKVMSVDLGILGMRQSGSIRSSSRFQDETDDENESNLEKLRLAEEKCDEVELKPGQDHKQVSPFGEGLSAEARFMSRKEAAWQQREAGAQNSYARRATPSSRYQAKIPKDEATSVSEQLQEAESEIRSLRTMTHKMILSQELMEEVVLKRCWLARYWKLCVDNGIYADIAETKYEFWSSFSPLPLEVVLSAGQKARDQQSSDKFDSEENNSWSASEPSGEGTIESMLLVEKGLRELCSLKVEEAVLFTMAQHRRAGTKSGQLGEGQNPAEAIELSDDEAEDVLFKQAWLTYFWRRVKNHGLEEDIADERLQFWIEQGDHHPSSQDAVEVERGLLELKKLGIEWQLWDVCHRRHLSDF